MAEAWVISSKEGIKTSLSKDRLSAYVELLGSIDDSVTVDLIKEEVKNRGIIYGLMPENIEDALKNRNLNEPILIARGTPCINGIDASIEFYTDPLRIDYTSDEHKNERVDYRELFPIKCVNAGDLLAKKTPLIQGKPGIDVKGDPILPPPVKDLNFKAGDNTCVSENGLELYATLSGIPIRKDYTVKISPVYSVKGDVDFSVGNIDFLGSVKVSGNVIQGFKIKATDDIIINGLVEGAEIISGNNVTIQNGIVGGEHSKIDARGDLNTKFINGAKVKVGGIVRVVGSIIGAEIEARVGVIAEGKEGIISGSGVSAGEYVIAETLGSNMGTKTEITVGCDSALFNRYQRLRWATSVAETEFERLEREVKQCEKIEGKLKKLPEHLKRKYVVNINRIQELRERLLGYKAEMEEVIARVDYLRTHSFIQANRMAYQDVVVKIIPLVYKVEKELSCAKFIRDVKSNTIKLATIITDKPKTESSEKEK